MPKEDNWRCDQNLFRPSLAVEALVRREPYQGFSLRTFSYTTAQTAWQSQKRPFQGQKMPPGPKGERRPSDVAQRAFKVFQLAIGEEQEKLPSKRRVGGKAGGVARARKMTGAKRSQIAQKAARARWDKVRSNGTPR